jgi:hypothetical protein
MCPKERPVQVDSALPDRKGATLLPACVAKLSLVPGTKNIILQLVNRHILSQSVNLFNGKNFRKAIQEKGKTLHETKRVLPFRHVTRGGTDLVPTLT